MTIWKYNFIIVDVFLQLPCIVGFVHRHMEHGHRVVLQTASLTAVLLTSDFYRLLW